MHDMRRLTRTGRFWKINNGSESRIAEMRRFPETVDYAGRFGLIVRGNRILQWSLRCLIPSPLRKEKGSHILLKNLAIRFQILQYYLFMQQ